MDFSSQMYHANVRLIIGKIGYRIYRWEFFVLSSQFFCNSKTLLKSFFFLNRHVFTHLTHIFKCLIEIKVHTRCRGDKMVIAFMEMTGTQNLRDSSKIAGKEE